MRKNKGFTLIELMVVILIVAILAAVLAPMMTGRVREAKWTEGKTGAGTIATALRAYAAENEGLTSAQGAFGAGSDFTLLGITDADLDGKYFEVGDYAVTVVAWTDGVLTYTIQVTAPVEVDSTQPQWQLDQAGTWTYIP